MEEDLKCAPRLPGCGTQHPHRALGGTCVLLAAAPTTPPCFRRWRRSSSLLAIFSGRNILNFGVQESLRTFLNPFFTGGVVKANGSCRACFLRKQSRGGECPRPLRLLTAFASTLPLLSPTVTSSPGAGEVFPQRESPWHDGKLSGVSANLPVPPEPLPLGEVASRSDDGEGARR